MLDYLEWKRSTTKNPQTPVVYGMWVRRFLDFLDGQAITLDSVMRFRKHLVDYGYSPKNIQYGLQLVRDYIHFQMTVHALDFPLSLLRIPQERSKSHYAVTYDEYRRMVDSLPLNEPMTLQRRLMISMLWDTGMRCGELLRLRISDINTRSAQIHNEKNHRNRTIAWSEQTDKILRFYLPLRKQLDSKEDFLFVSFKWKPCKRFSNRQLENIIKEVRTKVGITNEVRPHSFRHAFVHRQLRQKQPITTIAQMLGHSTTFNVLAYAQLNSAEIREAWGL